MLTFFLSAAFLIPATIVLLIIIGVLLEADKEGWATTLFCIGLALVGWTYKYDFLFLLQSHPFQIIGFVLAYIAIGIGWSVAKWTLYVKSIFDYFSYFKNTLQKKDIYKNKPQEVLNKLALRFIGYGYMDSNRDYTLEEILEKITPEAIDNKSKIVSWIAYFPISMLATLLNNPFRRFFEWVYENVSGIYDKITNSYKNKILNNSKNG